MHQHVVGSLLLLALIQNVSSGPPAVPFVLEDTVLTPTEGSCVEIKCTLQKAVNPAGAYWFWIKDAIYTEDKKDFNGIIIYSTNTTHRPVSPDFAKRVKYVGSPSTNWSNNSPQKLCSVQICDLKRNDSGNYSVRFVRPSVTHVSKRRLEKEKWITNPAANLKVENNPCLITFKAPPAVMENTVITLECSTSSSCSSYPQIRQGPTNSNKSKSTTFSFTARWTQDREVFSCQTHDNKDEHLIRYYTISMEYAPKEVVASPHSVNVKEGESVFLFCSGKGNPGPTFNWIQSGTKLSDVANWTIRSINASQAGVYSCRAANKHGIQTSNININVQYRPYVKIFRTPEKHDIREGEKITFECIVTNSNPPLKSIELVKNWSPVMTRGGSYIIESAKPEDSGDYICNATNAVGSRQTKESTLKVHYRPRNTGISIDGAQDNKVKAYHHLTFSCNTDAYPSPWYSWYHYKKSKPSLWAFMGKELKLTLSKVQRSDEGCYICNATNTVGKGDPSTPVCIEVLFPPTVVTLTMNPEVTEGQPVTVTCTTESSPPSAFMFYKSSTPSVQYSESNFSLTTTNVFHYTFNAMSTDAGDCMCRASNTEGFATSQSRNLVVKYAPKDVKVEAEPGLLVKENTSFTLNCKARSHPAVTSVTWMKMANEKNEHIRSHLDHIQITQTRLFVMSASRSDGGLYSCKATNDIGSEESQQVEVKVKYAPKDTKIVKGAEEQRHDGTSSVLLSCSSSCYPVATQYTWYEKTADKNYEQLTAYTQNITVTSQQSREYYCIAENELGKRKSDPVVVFDDRRKTWKIVLFCLLFLIIFCFVLLYRYRKKKTTQQQTNTNTQPHRGFPVWLSTGRNPLNDAEPSRSRDDLLPQQPCSPRVQQCQAAGPDTTPASNVSTVYSTVNLPQINPKPVKQQSGHTVDELSYASLYFGKKHTKQADDVYAKVSKPKAKEKEQEKQGTAKPDYENVSTACASNPQNLWESESDTSEDEVEVNYSQVNFKPKHGHQRQSSTSSSSSSSSGSDYETRYSEIKL